MDDKQKRFDDAVKCIEESPESQAVFDACRRSERGPMCLGCCAREAAIAQLKTELAEAREQSLLAHAGWKQALDQLGTVTGQLAEALRDGERYQALYQMAQVSISGFIVFGPMLLPDAAKWDGTTAVWNRDIFDAAVDAARGGAK